jgi:hypothetical protein
VLLAGFKQLAQDLESTFQEDRMQAERSQLFKYGVVLHVRKEGLHQTEQFLDAVALQPLQLVP